MFGGAEALIRGSSALALRMGISPLVIGLTVVAFGTSSPELVVSVEASAANSGTIALGNVIGSNICNIALILGLSALIRPVEVKAQVIQREIPVMILITVVFVIFLLNGVLGRVEGIILLAGIVLYVFYSYFSSRKERKEIQNEFEEEVPGKKTGLLISIILTVAGLGLLIGGSHFLVEGAVAAAERMGISRLIIGLTIIAVGTSLPELITSAVAAYKNKGDISIGNVVGSNIFNLLGIMGVASIINAVPSSELSSVDITFMILTAVILFPLSKTGFRISRIEGALLVSGYLVYLYFLIP